MMVVEDKEGNVMGKVIGKGKHLKGGKRIGGVGG